MTTAYTYDALGQLVRVDDGQENATWVYEYDQGGNILTKKKYVNGVETESKIFTYGNANWRDQLTKVNDKTITYDEIGNPLDDGTWAYTWQNGRQLQKMQKSAETVEFVYNENGLRVQKTAATTGVTKYTLHGKNVVHMKQGSNELHFFYDAQNKPAVVVYNGTPYSYVKNLQGDIVTILDSNGIAVVQYKYDAWGRPINKTGSMASTLGTVQPFRYRGYVYDEETGLYYLQSRYYNPENVRFLNADIYVSTGQGLRDSNMYTYCCNNPTMLSDAAGTDPLEQTLDETDLRPVDDLAPNIGRCPGSGGNNPCGRLGSPPHSGKVLDWKNLIKSKGISITNKEPFVKIEGGRKAGRSGDIGVLNSNGALCGIVQVGRVNKNGTPVAREMYAIYDFNLMGYPVLFVPYNSDEPIYTIFAP